MWSQDVYAKAWDFATVYHHGQTYGGSGQGQRIDYINHIGSVAMEVIWALHTAHPEADGDLAVQCALLHDVVEDTPVTLEELAMAFGPRVAAGVAALTKDQSIQDKVEKMADSLRRIQQQPQEVWMVKLADRVTNLYAPPAYWTAEKIASYREEARQIYEALHLASPALARRLLQKIEAYGRAPE